MDLTLLVRCESASQSEYNPNGVILPVAGLLLFGKVPAIQGCSSLWKSARRNSVKMRPNSTSTTPCQFKMLTPIVALFCLPGTVASEDSATPLPHQQAVHVLNRLAFGPSPGDVARVRKMGWRNWVDQQLNPESVDDSALDERLKKFPSLKMSMAETYRRYRPPKDLKPEDSREQRKLELEKQRLRRKLQAELDESVFIRAVESKRQFKEVIIDFWRNHLNVDSAKSPYWANHYEENVLRKYAFGKWEELLMASAKHPAMLVYLDNHVSKKGNVNENYARELMELHTLGVDNFYTQSDVIALTRVLTGWTCFWRYDDDEKEHWRFIFREEQHDTDPAAVLGLRLTGKGGQADGEMAVNYLANHEGTAQFISRKLCQYLVSDHPPEGLVDHASAVFRATGGDLAKVYRAIIMSPEFMDPANFGSKHKTPFEFVISSVRATSARIEEPRPALKALEAMGQPVYRCSPPTGYSDQAEAWLDPGALLHRWNFAMNLANDKMKGISIPKAFHKNRQDIVDIIPGGGSPELSEILAQTKDPRRMTGMTLGSRAFQQQ